MANPWRNTEREILQTLKKLKHATAQEIADDLQLNKKWILQKLRYLRLHRRVYVSDWKHVSLSGDLCHVYSLVQTDEDVDAVKPKPLTPTQRTTRSRAKRKTLEDPRWTLLFPANHAML